MTTRKTPAASGAGTASTTPAVPPGPALVNLDSAVFSGVSVKLDARLGSASMTVEQLLALRSGSVLTLEAQLNDLVELHLNGALVGRGEIVAVDDRFGVRIVDIAPQA